MGMGMVILLRLIDREQPGIPYTKPGFPQVRLDAQLLSNPTSTVHGPGTDPARGCSILDSPSGIVDTTGAGRTRIPPVRRAAPQTWHGMVRRGRAGPGVAWRGLVRQSTGGEGGGPGVSGP